MVKSEETRKVIHELCVKAKETELSFEEFYEKWPIKEDNKLFNRFYYCLEDAVQHTPAHFWTGETNYRIWHAHELYFELIIDCALLESELSFEEIYDIHVQAIEAIENVEADMVKDVVNKIIQQKIENRNT